MNVFFNKSEIRNPKSENNCGVFYPLQTFSKNQKINFKDVPICIEANNKKTLNILSNLAKSVSNNIYFTNSEQRKSLHLAAVFACNFTNHLYSISENILKKENIDFEILKPLIIETANKIKNHSPLEMQTGPAIRNDKEIIKEHLKLLKRNKTEQNIYKLLTENIIKISNQTFKVSKTLKVY